MVAPKPRRSNYQPAKSYGVILLFSLLGMATEGVVSDLLSWYCETKSTLHSH